MGYGRLRREETGANIDIEVMGSQGRYIWYRPKVADIGPRERQEMVWRKTMLHNDDNEGMVELAVSYLNSL
jgi:hypothetical protein